MEMTNTRWGGRWWWGCWRRNPGTQTFPWGNSSLPHTQNNQLQRGAQRIWPWNCFGMAKTCPSSLIPLHSHPQHPFLFLILPWWQLKTPLHSFLQVFFISFSFFFLIKNHKTIWAVFFKNPIYVAHFYYQYFFFFF